MLEPLSGAILVLWSSALANQVSTSEAPPQDSVELSPVVVVATRSPRQVNDVAASVTVVTAQQVANQLMTSAADLVRYEPSVVVPRSGTRFGSGGFIIRGIGGNRVAVEIDGVPAADQFDVGNFANAQRDLVDVGVISRVEILRGPASTLYGSDAIGGVVSYTTLRADELAGDAVRMRSAYRSFDQSLAHTLTVGGAADRFGALASLTRRSGEQVDAAALDGKTDDRRYGSTAVFARFDWDLSSQLQFSATVDAFNREVDSSITSVLGAGRFRSTTLLMGDDAQDRQRLSLSIDGVSDLQWAQSFRLLAYHQDSDTRQLTLEERAAQDLRRQRRFDFQTRATGIELGGELSLQGLNAHHQIGYGLDLQKSTVTELRDALQSSLAGDFQTRNVLGENFPVRDFPVSQITELGIYVHDEWQLPDERWTLIPALRFDQYHLDPSPDTIYLDDNPNQQVTNLRESRWSPRLGVLFDLSPHSNLFAQYARGFRAPPFADANIGLDIPLFNVRAIPNPDLKSEISDTLEMGWRWRRAQSQFNITAHITDYKNFIESKVRIGADPETGVIVFKSQNVESADIYGVEMSFGQSLERWSSVLAGLDVDLALSWTEGKNRQTGQRLENVSPAELTAGVNWQGQSLPLAASLRATVVRPMSDASRINTLGDQQFQPSGFAVVDLLASYRFAPTATLRGGVFNLADRRYWRWADVRGLAFDDPLIPSLSAPGRNLGLSLSFAW